MLSSTLKSHAFLNVYVILATATAWLIEKEIGGINRRQPTPKESTQSTIGQPDYGEVPPRRSKHTWSKTKKGKVTIILTEDSTLIPNPTLTIALLQLSRRRQSCPSLTHQKETNISVGHGFHLTLDHFENKHRIHLKSLRKCE